MELCCLNSLNLKDILKLRAIEIEVERKNETKKNNENEILGRQFTIDCLM